MAYDPTIPYDDLPLLPPSEDIETPAILKQCIAATRALAELKGSGSLIPEQSILINAIPLQEAKLSSEIENIVTTQDELFKAAIDESKAKDPHTKEVLRYRTALRHGFDEVMRNSFRLGLVSELCSIIHDRSISFRSTEQNYIGNLAMKLVIYTPPRGGNILQQKLSNLEEFLLSSDGPDPLIRLAVSHYQFEAIHPFTDGNGRAGRILNILYLLHAGLLEIPVLYLSRYIIHNKPEYYRLLRDVTETGAWESWIIYMLKGIEETALWTTNRIKAIRALFDSTVERCRTELSSAYSKELVEVIFRQPYCKIEFLVDAGIAKRQTASLYLKELEKIGILSSEKFGREIIYKHPALVKVLTE